MNKDVKFVIKEMLDNNSIPYKKDINLRTRTWVKRGGKCSFYITPQSVEQLKTIIDICENNGPIDYIIVGHTSNILFSNEKMYDVVISTKYLKHFKVNEDCIECEPGVVMRELSSFCNENGYEGYSGFIGLPGTIAGAAINNAGCFGSITSNVILGLQVYSDGKESYLSNADMQYDHRTSIIKSGILKYCVTYVYLNKRMSDSTFLIEKANKAKDKRGRLQEGPSKNLGSTYAFIEYKNFPIFLNKVAYVIHRIIKKPIVPIFKHLLLLFYGSMPLKNYISNYNIGCFIWRDDKADIRFTQYKHFINRVTKKAKIEIEEK